MASLVVTELTMVTVDIVVVVETEVAVIVPFGASPIATSRLAEIKTPAIIIAAAMARYSRVGMALNRLEMGTSFD